MTAVANEKTGSHRFIIRPLSHLMSNNTAKTVSIKSIQEEDSENLTIFEKMHQMFLKDAMAGNVKNGHFFRCNYLEELVKLYKLNYISLSLYPTYCSFSYIDHCINEELFKTKLNEERELIESIDNEEIPAHFIALYIKKNLKVIYDYHIILQVQKFTTMNKKEPLFSTYVLLKPTHVILSSYINIINSNENEEEKEEEYIVNQEIVNEQEEVILFYISEPLYLGIDVTVLVQTTLQEFFGNPFVSSLLTCSIIENQKYESELSPRSWGKESLISGKSHSVIPETEQSKGFPNKQRITLSCLDLKKKLWSLLDSRILNLDNSKYLSVVEIFYFEHISLYENGSSKLSMKTQKDEMTVYFKNGSFYTFLRNCASDCRQSDKKIYSSALSRKGLDEYILAFAVIISKKFYNRIRITRRNGEDEQIFFHCEDKGSIEDYKNDHLENSNQREKRKKPFLAVAEHKITVEQQTKSDAEQPDAERDHEENLKQREKLKNKSRSLFSGFQACPLESEIGHTLSDTRNRTQADNQSSLPTFHFTKEELWSFTL